MPIFVVGLFAKLYKNFSLGVELVGFCEKNEYRYTKF